MTTQQAPSFEVQTSPEETSISLSGTWTTLHLDTVERPFMDSVLHAAHSIVLNIANIAKLDTNGAWILEQYRRKAVADGKTCSISGAEANDQILLTTVGKRTEEKAPPKPVPFYISFLNNTGRSFIEQCKITINIVGFLGEVVTALARSLLNPRRFRVTALFYHLEHVGLRGIPIIALLSFLIGMVLAYMGAQQLQKFGAQVFVIQLVQISVLRELGILLTAIVIAGRSGSAFTAQIGAMISNEEIYAMKTSGLDPVDTLVIPRVLALIIMLPILGFIADIMGLLGGALMVWQSLDIGLHGFIIRLHETLNIWDFYVGIIKAPFFAIVIATIGCFQGMQVTGSAESVGRLTTTAVIESIFAVIVIDAGFAIFFAAMGI
ncbi:ABC transporter permease [Halodesulfovibrio sp. MK-HDV]|jgi:phospholipid/cholesterol/gamma-HCH transport system permease protein|uniref:MlaE family ABC transporter permease n=1 Tax=unclassified Halodesulfovibrio TaxID=2644657 RepID=UPI00136A64F8|nr:ABC transporter permease [Halodesulfovibrio sp. MK-HDV]KAF1074649.1 putative phospholipid ABC transporter permease protein MlaE [Halodesulfovibrio sp. MK-HDV]